MEIKEHFARWIARRLAERDSQSPWFGLVQMGGSKTGARQQGLTRPVNFASLEAGVSRTLAKSGYIHDLTEPEAQYAIIRNYWNAVRQVFAEEWAHPKEFLVLKNIGVMSFSILGGTIIDRCMARGKIDVGSMGLYLGQARGAFNWSKDAVGERSVAGMAGNRAALIIAGEMAAELSDEEDTARTMKALTERLLADATVEQ